MYLCADRCCSWLTGASLSAREVDQDWAKHEEGQENCHKEEGPTRPVIDKLPDSRCDTSVCITLACKTTCVKPLCIV